MSLANIKRQFNKANQLISEKIGNAKGTELESDYVEKEKQVQNFKDLLEDLLSKTTEYLQPNPSYRAKLMTVNVLHKIQRKNGQKSLYPQIEGQLSDIFAKYGVETTDETFRKALNDCSDSFKELEEIKNGLEDSVKQNFIEPLLGLKSQDLKEISAHRKKVTSRRLNFDSLKRTKEKDTAEIDDAEKKFLEAKEVSLMAMTNFLDSQAEHINIIAEFIKAEREYHHQAADVLESLYAKFLQRRDEANLGRATKSISPKTKISLPEDSDGDKSSPTVGFVMKKGYDLSKTIPTCRALFDFKAESENELSFKEGDTIRLIQQVDENWFEGELHGKTGFFPINFVEVLVPLRD